MNFFEIILLIIGILIFVVSFRIPTVKEEELEETKELAKVEIKEVVKGEMKNVHEQVEGVVDETITYAVEKTERFMDRITNEKMNAVQEYSDTVLEQIKKNHEEVVFLYDMLNGKQENLKTMVAEVSELQKKTERLSMEIPKTEETQKEQSVSKEAELQTATKPQRTNDVAKVAPQIEEAPEVDFNRQTTDVASGLEKSETPEWEINFTGEAGQQNNNERILELHKAGKSNIAIAKELDLGVGEVKLVIGLYEGV